jgi:hypothetical protein
VQFVDVPHGVLAIGGRESWVTPGAGRFSSSRARRGADNVQVGTSDSDDGADDPADTDTPSTDDDGGSDSGGE